MKFPPRELPRGTDRRRPPPRRTRRPPEENYMIATAPAAVDTLSLGDVVSFPGHITLRNTTLTVFAVDYTYDGRWVLGLRTNGARVIDPCDDQRFTSRLRHVCLDGTSVVRHN
jgi:hypothetical protein